MSAASQDLP